MELFKSYSLVESQEGYDVVLYYYDIGDVDVEFASEFGGLEKDKESNFKQNIIQSLAKNFPNKKINSVKVMAGAVLLSSFVVTSIPPVNAVETNSEQIVQAKSAYNYDINIKINGKSQSFQNKPLLYNNITYVPLYEFAGIIGANTWSNSTSNTVGITKGNTNIAFVKGSSLARVNGVQTSMPASMIIDNITYAPLKFLSENLGYTVSYDSSTKTASISNNNSKYTVSAGDSLWTISQKFGISVASLKSANNLTSDIIHIGQVLTIPNTGTSTPPSTSNTYTVVAGDTLWKISQKYGVSVANLKSANNLTSDTLKIGQTLIIPNTGTSTPPSTSNTYTVVAGDTLWKISQKYGVSVASLKSTNNLTSDTLSIGQVLKIPSTGTSTPNNNTSWPSVTYIVQEGDTATSIAKKFGMSTQDILKYNYMSVNDWFDAGDKIAISGYAPRVYTVTPGQASAPAQKGALVDWVYEGQYLVKRNSVFTIVDVTTGKQFKAKMIGGYNHSDIEPLTSSDTAIMKSLFGTWQWSPRAVVIYIDGMNIAASLSGMPHSVDTINNGVTGHFDLYMKNSKSHSSTTSTAYMQQHANMVLKAAGQ